MTGEYLHVLIYITEKYGIEAIIDLVEEKAKEKNISLEDSEKFNELQKLIEELKNEGII